MNDPPVYGADSRFSRRRAHLNQVSQMLKQGQTALAIAQCQRMLTEYKDDIEVLHFLGLGYLQQEKLQEANACLSQALRTTPASPNLLNDLGTLRMKQEAYGDAVRFFSKALDIDATHSDALNNIATTFIILRQPTRAREYLERLMRVQPFSSDVHANAAQNSLALSDVEQAIRRGRRAVRLAPHNTSARLSLAEALEAGGRFKQAKFQYLAILGRDPVQIGALSKLLSLKGTNLSEQYERNALRLTESAVLKDPDHVALHLGLARYYDQQCRYDRSFEHLQEGNRVRSRNHPFDGLEFSRAVDRLISTFSAEFMRSAPSGDTRSAKPIFIVGMPRSGTTLVEQILASHSRIAAGGELPTIIAIASQMGRADVTYPERVRELESGALAKMATQYLEKLKSVSEDATRVTDKMPFNFLHLGLIRVLFPGAKIIHCKRDPRDTCVSCFFTGFNENLQFASDLESLGRYYVDYWRLMTHWHNVLLDPIHELQYERLISYTETTVRELLSYCDLAWEPNCVQFYRTERGVRTPSTWQVRQPIYAHSVGRWRNYQKHLQPLLRILGPALAEDSLYQSPD